MQPEVTLPLTLVAELLTGWKGRRGTRERVISKIYEQHPELPDAVVADLCDTTEEHVRWIKGDPSGRSSIPKRTPRSTDQLAA